MKKYLLLISLIISVFFTACGGGSSSSTTDSTNDTQTKIGYFIDSAVEGLYYSTQSTQQGTTKSDGSFEYLSSDNNISFKIGNITIGTISVKNINNDNNIYIQDLVGVDRENIEDEKVLKIARFLQSLNSSTDSNSIKLLVDDIEKLTEDKTIDEIDLTRQLGFVGKSLKNIDDVKEHLGNTIRINGIALYNYTPQTQDSNITTIKNIITTAILNASDKNDKYLKYEIKSDPTNGRVELIANSNSFKYIPDIDFIGDDSLTYQAYDGQKYSKVAKVNIIVNDIPISNSTDTTPPTAPTIVSLNSQNNAITLFWLNATDNTTTQDNIIYEIHISADENFTANANTLKQTLINTLEADISGLNSDQLYYIKVKAIDGARNEVLSEESNIKTLAEVPVRTAIVVKKANDLHLENAKQEGNKLIFEDSKKAQVPQKNDILIGTQDNGYLKKVVSVSKSEDTTEVQTTQAAISDIFDSLEIKSNTKLFDDKNQAIVSKALKRIKKYTANNKIQTTTSWNSGRFSATDIKDIETINSIKTRGIVNIKNIFTIKTTQDIVNIKTNEKLSIEFITKLEDDTYKLTSMKLQSISHPTHKSDYLSTNFIQKSKNDKKIYSYFIWDKPKDNFISDKPYTITVKVEAINTNNRSIIKSTKIVEVYIINNSISTRRVNTSSDTNSKLTNKVTYDFEPSLQTDVDLGNKAVTIKLVGNLDFDVVSKLDFSAKGTAQYSKNILTKKYTTLYVMPPPLSIPVYQEITLSVNAEFTANANTAIKATSTLNTNFELGVGIKYENGSWTPIKENKFQKDYTATIEVEGGATLEVRLIPNIKIEFYKVAAGELSIEPWARGDLAASGNISYNTDFISNDIMSIYKLEKLNIDAGIDVKIGASLETFWWGTYYPAKGEKQTILEPSWKIFSLPTISLSKNSSDICSANPLTITAITTDGTYNSFKNSYINWKVFPNEGASITPQSDTKKANFTFSKKNEYKVFFIGGSEELGQHIGKQYKYITIDTRYCDTNEDNSSNITYSWKSGSWGRCNNGTQTRTMICKSSSGSTVSDSYCPESKPDTSLSCSSITYSWQSGSWGRCIGDCGTNNANKIRTVVCKSSDGNTVVNSYCTDTKLDTSQNCTASQCIDKNINVTYPISSSNIKRGISYTIRWNSTGNVSNIDIQLYKKGASSQTEKIADNISNDGSYTWTLSDNGVIGDYKIRISDSNDWGTVYDFSDVFTITSNSNDNGSITITSPTSSSDIKRGNSYTIRWNSTGNASNIDIQLYKKGASSQTEEIADNISNDGSYTWILSNNGVIGDYKIRISDSINWSTVYDFSDVFTIK